jgi:RNA polymerase-binding transcription factor DksA
METSPVRSTLETARVSALDRVRTLVVELAWLAGDADHANGDDEHDPEGSTLAFERARVAALLTEAERVRMDLYRTLTRLGSGTYSTCEGCGREIPPERLEALPATRSCFDCAMAVRPGASDPS